MCGCRDCDWDACDKCTDKAEGGVVKWRFVKGLAEICLEMLSMHSLVVAGGRDELHRIVDGVKRRDPVVIRALGQLLDVPGEVTLHEFTTLVLPALHAALVSTFELESCDISKEGFFGTGHRKKKLRMGLAPRNHSRSTSHHTQDKSSRKSTKFDADPFICALVRLLSTRESKERTVPPSSSSECGSSLNEDDDALEETLEEEFLSRDINSRSPESKHKKSMFVPQLLRMLHASLAFHERLIVTRHTSSESDGELQSLLSTIEIQLRPAQDTCKNFLPTEAGVTRISCWELQNNVAYAEVLLPILELQQHIIRTCGIRIPSYLRYCRQ